MRSDRLGETLLPKRLALPVFASDALSSVAYAPDEIFLTLGLAGGALALTSSWKIALAVVVVMVVVIMSYRQNVHAYPSGGGDYEVASVNLGPEGRAHGRERAARRLRPHRRGVGVLGRAERGRRRSASCAGTRRRSRVAIVVALTAMNLRGVRESGAAFAIPTYLFMVAVIGMALVGLLPAGHRRPCRRPRAPDLELLPEPGYEALGGIALAFLHAARVLLGLRGAHRRRGDQQRRPRLPEAQEQERGDDAARSWAPSPSRCSCRWSPSPAGPASSTPRTRPPSWPATACRWARLRAGHRHGPGGQGGVLRLPARASSSSSIVTGLILVLAANTAFNGFPVLGSILARDGFLPRQLHTRGDRLAFSNGIIILAAAAAGAHRASTTPRSPASSSSTSSASSCRSRCSQVGMVRHWNRHLRARARPRGAQPDAAQPGHQRRRRRHVGHRARRRPRRRSSSTAPATRIAAMACSSSS